MSVELNIENPRPTTHDPRHPDYDSIFCLVNKPSRYIGGEWNSIKKPEPFRKHAVSVCLCFPDLYETGFANGGIEILYQIVNRRPDALAERAYSPDTDLAALLRQQNVPFFSLESRTPLAEFDIVGFGLPYELCYTNILEMLDLSRIPFRSSQRDAKHPLLIAGGPCAVNPEPVADFFDAIVIGDGEEIIGEIIQAVQHYRNTEKNKKELMLQLSKIPGLYVPSLYDVRTQPDGAIAEVTPKFPEVPAKVAYRRASLEKPEGDFPTPIAPVVPFVQTVHDRLTVEIQRGCPWRCRFCQAGFSYRPYRERSQHELVRMIEEGLKNTGYDAVTLAGLSAADHTEIIPLLQTLSEKFTPKRVAIGLPSTRADRFTLALAEILYSVRRQSITFAPEAGTERLRRVIRKELQEFEISETLRLAYQHGWKNVKLYFMYGLPTETQADMEGIVQLIRKSKKENPALSFTLTLSPFVPKPHTPYQWHRQESLETLQEKLNFLRKNLPAKIRAHGLEQIVLEGVLSRGDRRCGELLETAWKLGAKFDEWSERFRFDLWQKAFELTALSPDFFCYRQRTENETFPWDHLQGGPDKRALWNDYQAALRQADEPPPLPHLKERPPVPTSHKSCWTIEKTVQRLRFKLSRHGAIRFLSHLEQIEMIRRVLRRAELPLVFTTGFHPQIKCSFGPAISVGYESECEYFDVEFSKRVEIETAMRKISTQLPNGFSLLKVSRVPLFFPSLESMLNRVHYTVEVEEQFLIGKDQAELHQGLKEFLNREELFLEKEKKIKGRSVSRIKIPLKPIILQMELQKFERGQGNFYMALKFGPGKNVKPEKIVALFLGFSEEQSRNLLVRRQAFFIEKLDGILAEP